MIDFAVFAVFSRCQKTQKYKSSLQLRQLNSAKWIVQDLLVQGGVR
jgi:hypothetical protein